MCTLTVQAPLHPYPIFIGHDLIGQADILPRPYLGKEAAITINEIVAFLYLQASQTVLDKLGILRFSTTLPDGEKYKSWQTFSLIFNGLMQNRAGCKTTLIALGDGAIGDMVGFAVVTYQHGVPFIQAPTTLLSQVDSSADGKTAINHPFGKNMIGVFYQPQVVLVDLFTLKTLPERELPTGMTEVIEYGALGDIGSFEWLEQNMADSMAQSQTKLTHAIYHCCKMKADTVAQDKTEQGIRAWLNPGRTFGHTIEVEMDYGIWLHGEAVAVDCVSTVRLSEVLGKTIESDTRCIATLLEAAKLSSVPPKFALGEWIGYMSHDKKASSGVICFVGLNRLGEADIIEITDMEILR